MNERLIKEATTLSKLLEHFSGLDKVHLYIKDDVGLLAYRTSVLYNKFRGKEKMYCIDAQHYIKYKKKYSDMANYNICFVCELALENKIVIDKSKIFSKHLINVIFKVNNSKNMSEKELFENTKEWYFIEDNILKRRFENYKRNRR